MYSIFSMIYICQFYRKAYSIEMELAPHSMIRFQATIWNVTFQLQDWPNKFEKLFTEIGNYLARQINARNYISDYSIRIAKKSDRNLNKTMYIYLSVNISKTRIDQMGVSYETNMNFCSSHCVQ